METVFEIDLVTEACAMTALFIQYEEPIVAANDEEFPEYENLYGMPS